MDSGQPVMLVCVGAGASHDCLVASAFGDMNVRLSAELLISPKRAVPPLTKDLVSSGTLQNWHIGQHQKCVPVVDWLRRNMESGNAEAKSFEDLLVQYRD